MDRSIDLAVKHRFQLISLAGLLAISILRVFYRKESYSFADFVVTVLSSFPSSLEGE